MVISEYKYQIGESIDNYLQSGINYKTIHQRYYKDMSYETVLEYHRQYKMINELLLECQKNSDFLYNVDLPIPTLRWISLDTGTNSIPKISTDFLIELNTHWRKVTGVEYIQIRHAFAPYKGYPKYHTTKVTKVLNYSLSDIIQWFNQYKDVCEGLSVKTICNKYNIKHYILQTNMRRWLWLGVAINNAIHNDSAIENLAIDSRYYKILRSNGINFIEQLEDMTDNQLKQLKGIKDRVVSMIRDAVIAYKQQF